MRERAFSASPNQIRCSKAQSSCWNDAPKGTKENDKWTASSRNFRTKTGSLPIRVHPLLCPTSCLLYGYIKNRLKSECETKHITHANTQNRLKNNSRSERNVKALTMFFLGKLLTKTKDVRTSQQDFTHLEPKKKDVTRSIEKGMYQKLVLSKNKKHFYKAPKFRHFFVSKNKNTFFTLHFFFFGFIFMVCSSVSTRGSVVLPTLSRMIYNPPPCDQYGSKIETLKSFSAQVENHLERWLCLPCRLLFGAHIDFETNHSWPGRPHPPDTRYFPGHSVSKEKRKRAENVAQLSTYASMYATRKFLAKNKSINMRTLSTYFET